MPVHRVLLHSDWSSFPCFSRWRSKRMRARQIFAATAPARVYLLDGKTYASCCFGIQEPIWHKYLCRLSIPRLTREGRYIAVQGCAMATYGARRSYGWCVHRSAQAIVVCMICTFQSCNHESCLQVSLRCAPCLPGYQRTRIMSTLRMT